MTQQKQKPIASISASHVWNHKTIGTFLVSLTFLCFGGSFLFIPLYQWFCQTYGILIQQVSIQWIIQLLSVLGYNTTLFVKSEVTVLFFTKTEKGIEFLALQPWLTILPGQTVLTFFRLTNETSEALTIATTYSIQPSSLALVVNKLQCFCFEQMELAPKEEVLLPLLFFLRGDMDTIGFPYLLLTYVVSRTPVLLA